MKAERGFTLLEIIIALAVFALLAAAVLSATQFVLRQEVALEERLFATWLADNQLAELRLQGRPSLGQRQWLESFGREQWQLAQSVSASAGKPMLRVEIEVRRAADERLVHQLSSWLRVVDE